MSLVSILGFPRSLVVQHMMYVCSCPKPRFFLHNHGFFYDAQPRFFLCVLLCGDFLSRACLFVSQTALCERFLKEYGQHVLCVCVVVLRW